MIKTSQTAFRTLVGAAGILAAVAATLPTAALSAEALPTRNVVYSDLNLDTAAGQKQLDRRIRSAASAVCFTDSRELAMIAAADRCRADAIAAARSQIQAKTVLAAR